MKRYNITAVRRGTEVCKIVTRGHKEMFLPSAIVGHARAGDVLCEYVSKNSGAPVAYYCRKRFGLCDGVCGDCDLHAFASVHLSWTERVCLNAGLVRTLLHNEIKPTLSIENNLRLLLASQKIKTR